MDILFVLGVPVLVYFMYQYMKESKPTHGTSREPDPIVHDSVESMGSKNVQ